MRIMRLSSIAQNRRSVLGMVTLLIVAVFAGASLYFLGAALIMFALNYTHACRRDAVHDEDRYREATSFSKLFPLGVGVSDAAPSLFPSGGSRAHTRQAEQTRRDPAPVDFMAH